MTDPVLAIVIPVFRHSVLMVDAVESALAQRADFPIRIVIVNDGCPHPETHETGMAYARAWPGRVTYLKKPNGGLSSARNFGISHVLAHLPSVRALYMLDADNALRPDAMARALAALEADPDAGWIYPDIDMVGLASGHDYSGPYSVLLHTAMNTCEAGSLIRRAVFEAGVMFDTSFRSGFEDWDFFLSAVEAGFRGKYFEGFGFLYRKRPESMLADSEREREPILARLRAKHRALFSPRALLELEQAEAPRYAFLLSDLSEVRLTTDPVASAEVLTTDEFLERFWAAASSPGSVQLPSYFVLTRSMTLNQLEANKLLHGVLWHLETILDQTDLAGLQTTCGETDRVGLKMLRGNKFRLADASILIVRTRLILKIVADADDSWIKSLTSSQPQPRVAMAEVTFPNSIAVLERDHNAALADFTSFLQQVRHSTWANGALALRPWREQDLIIRSQSEVVLRKRFGNQAVLPLLRGSRRHMGLILSIVEFGGVEKVALNYARAFSNRGWAVHVFIVGAHDAAITAEWRIAICSVTFLLDPDYTPWGGGDRRYFGTEVPGWTNRGNHPRLLALLYWLDAVVDLHSGAALALMGELRRFGVVTVSSLHVADLSPGGRPTGSPFLALAYEHAIDIFAPCSYKLCDLLHAIGVPEDKIAAVPNAPGFEIGDSELSKALIVRSQKDAGPLRALFIGRLDAQKGIERLAEVMSLSEHLDVKWRIIGKPVLADHAHSLHRTIIEALEAPLTKPEELIEAFAEADVLVLLSEYEGLPLTVLEAMRQGVVPVVTDVGAVAEVVRDRVNGIILPLENAVDACLKALHELTTHPTLLEMLSKSATQAVHGRNWIASTEQLSRAIDCIAEGRSETVGHDALPHWKPVSLSPDLLDEELVDLTPNSWSALKNGGARINKRIARYEEFAGFFQFGAPEGCEATVHLSTQLINGFNGAQQIIFSLKPKGTRPAWFTYELILSAVDLCGFSSLDWRIRFFAPPIKPLFAQFILDGTSDTIKVDLGRINSLDLGSLMRFSLNLNGLALEKLRLTSRVRLIIATDGHLLPLDIFDFSIFGRSSAIN